MVVNQLKPNRLSVLLGEPSDTPLSKCHWELFTDISVPND